MKKISFETIKTEIGDLNHIHIYNGKNTDRVNYGSIAEIYLGDMNEEMAFLNHKKEFMLYILEGSRYTEYLKNEYGCKSVVVNYKEFIDKRKKLNF